MPIKEFTHNWKDWKNIDCSCRVRIFAGAGEQTGKTVVITTDTNHGNSVTNQAEHIATDVIRRQNIHRLDLVFIEHYEKQAVFEETYDLVNFKWNTREKRFEQPNWKHLTKEDVEKMAGEVL
jgi:hypothetical protein